MEPVRKVEAPGPEEVSGAELETRKVVWESGSPVEQDKEEEEEGVVEARVPRAIVYAHRAEQEYLIRRESPAIRWVALNAVRE